MASTVVAERVAANRVAPVGRLTHALLFYHFGEYVGLVLRLGQRAAANQAYAVILDVSETKLNDQAVHVLDSLRRALKRHDRWLYLVDGDKAPNGQLYAGIKGVRHFADMKSAARASETYVSTDQNDTEAG